MNEENDDLSECVALFRHRLIARLLPEDLSPQQRQRELTRIASGEHQIPGTLRTRVAESTLRDWLRDYRAGGFDALKPKRRIDAGHPRTLAPAVAERQYADHAGSFDDEIALLVVHGILHVLGHDHAEPEETERMRTRELELLIELHWHGDPPPDFRHEHV